MELKMEREQFEKLLQLVYLGHYVVTSCRGAEKSVQGYDEVADMLYLKRYMAEAAISDCEDIEAKELADIRDRLYDSTHTYFDEFKKDIFFEKLPTYIQSYSAVELVHSSKLNFLSVAGICLNAGGVL